MYNYCEGEKVKTIYGEYIIKCLAESDFTYYCVKEGEEKGIYINEYEFI